MFGIDGYTFVQIGVEWELKSKAETGYAGIWQPIIGSRLFFKISDLSNL
jgi:hypothetical protein